MRNFFCPNCGQRLAFKNSVCLSCGSALGFRLAEFALIALDQPTESTTYRLCENLHIAQCNWVVDAAVGGMCESCRLTRTRPADSDTEALVAFADAEMAKRRLVLELAELGLPIVGRDQDPVTGLAFDLLGSRRENVMTGHQDGVITLDLAEGDDVHRERLRVAMDEPYRTLLGHFRHEIGHYYFLKLITDEAKLARFRELFGDPDADYQAALDRHYRDGAPVGWEAEYVSSYATMHPAEDWAETFAHYLHIRDTADTAAEFGFAPAAATFERTRGRLGPAAFDLLIELWLPLAWALNMLNRSMGHPDMYPFVLPDPVLAKMRFVHDVCVAERSAGPQPLPT